MMGFIYLLECADDDHTEYKIGFTKDGLINAVKTINHTEIPSTPNV